MKRGDDYPDAYWDRAELLVLLDTMEDRRPLVDQQRTMLDRVLRAATEDRLLARGVARRRARKAAHLGIESVLIDCSVYGFAGESVGRIKVRYLTRNTATRYIGDALPDSPLFGMRATFAACAFCGLLLRPWTRWTHTAMHLVTTHTGPCALRWREMELRE